MIGKLKGIVDTVDRDYLILDVAGVGYIVFCSSRTLSNLPAKGEAASLLIETHVREDSINLYGFKDAAEKEWFKELITVKGVGPKLALAILGALSPTKLSQALAAKDKAAFKQISGVGPKLAERILTELKDKMVFGDEELVITKKMPAKSDELESSLQADAISALTNLGYNRSEAYNVTNKLLAQNDNLTISDLIKNALKELAR